MKKYTKYLKYILVHKYYVMVECFKKGQYWRGITHDISKFRPSEFIPYARFFNGTYQSEKDIPKGLSMSYKGILTKESVKKDFDVAWLKHIHRNPHHHQHWVLREDDGGSKILEMPDNYIDEMVCDWRGAGMAQTGTDNTKKWYEKNKDKMLLDKTTRRKIELMIKHKL